MMDFLVSKPFKQHSSVGEIIDDRANAARVPEKYKLVDVQHPENSTIASRRKVSTWQTSQDRGASIPECRTASPSGSYRTILTRDIEGRAIRIERPVRDTLSISRYSSPDPRVNAVSMMVPITSPSVYDNRPERNTMMTTMSEVDAALSEQREYRRTRRSQRFSQRHSRKDRSSATTSRTSGDIQIGHIEEADDDAEYSDYTTSHYSEGCGYQEEPFYAGDRHSTGCNSADPFYLRALSGIQAARSEVRRTPTPLCPAYVSPGSQTSLEDSGKAPAQAPHALGDRYISIKELPMNPWTKRLARCGSYLVAVCSIFLPTLFLALGIIIMFSKGKMVSSDWSAMDSLVEIAVAIWPIAYAAVVAQCFKTWFLFQVKQGNPKHNEAGLTSRQPLSSPRTEAAFLFLFLAWCLSPIGPQSLQLVYGAESENQQDQGNVWFVDRTGDNQMWSVNSTGAGTASESAANRSEVVRAIGERFIDGLLTESSGGDTSNSEANYSLPNFFLSDLDNSDSTLTTSGPLETNTLSRRDFRANYNQSANTGPRYGNVTFQMTTSYFDFTCGNWSETTRYFENSTVPSQISYSPSESLGLRMVGGDNSTLFPSVEFLSLNRLGTPNETNTPPLVGEDLEYSSIVCNYTQLFWAVPVRCNRGDPRGSEACIQSDNAQLLLTSAGFQGTTLGDFAVDFVNAGNMPPVAKAATATERYIQKGGPVDPNSLVSINTPVAINLSATISPNDFASRFGYIFNSWVALGYCPQCSDDVVADNTSSIPTYNQNYYRHAVSTRDYLGAQVYTVSWSWLAVYIAFTIVLLIAAFVSVAAEANVVWRTSSRDTAGDEHLFELRLPKRHSTFNSRRSAISWSQRVTHDKDAAAGEKNFGRMRD